MTSTTSPGGTALTGQVALVAGATRGAGRGIAVELGAAGATVYVTGRTTAGSPSPMQRPETIDETAELVNRAGGTGIPVQADHADASQVRSLIERIDREHGRLDLLVNDIWGGDPLTQWGAVFWEHDLDKGLRLLRGAVETPHHHQLARRPPDDPHSRRAHRGSHRRHRDPVPRLAVLRPRQGVGDPPRPCPGRRAQATRHHGSRPDTGIPALRSHARPLRRNR